MAEQKIQGGTLDWNGIEFFLLATKETMRGMKKAAIFTQGTAKKMIGGAGTGRKYRRTKAGKFHTASSAGKPPARDSGILANSVSFDVKRKGFIVRGRVGPDISKIRGKRRRGGKPITDPEYGVYLEKGTSRMAARPWLIPSVIKATPTITRILQKAVSGR
jgi:hypothetical protein